MEAGAVTRYVILFATIGLVGYNIFVGLRFGPEATISVQMYELSRQFPIIPLAFGVVIGHIWWPLATCVIEYLIRR